MDNPIAPQVTQAAPTAPSQSSQEVSTTQQNASTSNPYDLLDDIHQMATDMRAKWLPYKMITDAIEQAGYKPLKEQTLMTWFMKGGVCYEALEWMKSERIKQRAIDLQEMEGHLKDGAIAAVGLLKRGVYDQSITKLQKEIAQDILDRAGYPKVSKIEGKHEVESDSMNVLAQALRVIADNSK